MSDDLNTWKDDNRSHWLAVDNPRHTSVLGYRASSNGAGLWKELDWRWWWIDGTETNYLHVRTSNKYLGKWDGTVYRVRCWYDSYKGWPVRSIGIGFRKGRLFWIVRTTRPRELD